jgi:hypothetical protein
MTSTLYLCERPGAPVASIPLDKVKGAVGLKLVRGDGVVRYDFRGGPTTINPGQADGEPVITSQIEGHDDYLLAN